MTPFYSTDDRRQRLAAAAGRWLGTPFRAGSAVCGPGGGVDCVHLAQAVHHEAGALAEPLALPSLPMGWHLSHTESGILDFFRRPDVRARVQHIDRDEPLRHGDLVAFKVGLAVHHLATALAGADGVRLLHVPRGHSVGLWPVDHPALKIAAIWRILEERETPSSTLP